jgi:hypothetical protein
MFNFKVNSWFLAAFQWTLILDDDPVIHDADGNFSPSTQLKSVVGLGITYKLENNN